VRGLKDDPGRLRRYLLLDDHGHFHPVGIQAVTGGVGPGALVPQSDPAGADRRQQILQPDDVEEGVVLTGEGGFGQILGGGGGADGGGDGPIRLSHCLHHLRRHLRLR